MRKYIFLTITIICLGTLSCSNNNPKNEETAQVEEEEIGCLCCEVEVIKDSIPAE